MMASSSAALISEGSKVKILFCGTGWKPVIRYIEDALGRLGIFILFSVFISISDLSIGLTTAVMG